MPTLTWDDLKAIRAEVPTVKYAAAQLRSNAQLASEDQNWNTSVYGVTTEYFLFRTWPTAIGSPMTEGDVESGSKVVFLGQTVAGKLALLSVAADFGVTQVVDANWGVHGSIRKSIFTCT